jgi:hypothetical protein
MDLLAQGERSVEDLAEFAGMEVSDTSAQLRTRLRPGLVAFRQFSSYLASLLHGSLGTSYTTGNPVTSDLLFRHMRGVTGPGLTGPHQAGGDGGGWRGGVRAASAQPWVQAGWHRGFLLAALAAAGWWRTLGS